ncbi:MAG TPA: glycoside hydrolase family 125 protein [Phnomibacter sp.]|nr:glycoside hydrolase family 125 protein [Phnomibacter sp.]
MNRRQFVQQSTLTGAAFIVSKYGLGQQNEFANVRVAKSNRHFSSPAVEKLIADFQKNVANKEMGWLFGNCFPNTLDTTVDFTMVNGRPDTYVITGDIDAMWLRDSSAQVWPYLPLMKEDKNLQMLVKGVINRQVQCILLDPYANAFFKDASRQSEWQKTDITNWKPGIHERKWEIDSLCYPIRLAFAYWEATGDTSIFTPDWKEAMRLVLQTFKEQQRQDGKGPYTFQRTTSWATDGVPLAGYGYPARPNGMICSMFRPSDDATIFPYLIPSNWFAVFALDWLHQMARAAGEEPISRQAFEMGTSLAKVLWEYGNVLTAKFDSIWAYETNGLGSCNLMDDANVPSLLSIPYLGDPLLTNPNQPIWQNTRRYVLSESNPFFFKGTAGEGIGSPHTLLDMIWPIGIAIRGLTSTDEVEIKHCLDMLQTTHAGTGFMHESFHKDDPSNFTRKWFAWANSLFGEFAWKVYRRKPHLLNMKVGHMPGGK